VIGVEYVGGDMFKSVPSGDAIFMKVLPFQLTPYFIFDLPFNHLSVMILRISSLFGTVLSATALDF
jgi:hypothetical protein